MTTIRRPATLFRALLRHWRGRRGLSQLDLALAADVSARHISFLETGRSQPSREMVHLLGRALAVPLREQNELLAAAGFEREIDESLAPHELPGPLRQALERMKAQQEPYPMVVLNRLYQLIDANRAAQILLPRFLHDPSAVPPPGEANREPVNMLRAVFDERMWQSAIINFDEVGRDLLWRAKRELLARPTDEPLAQLVAEIEEMPSMPRAWRHVDLTRPSDPTLVTHLRARDGLELSFVTTITAFSAPQNVALEELRIESYFPATDATAAACHEICSTGGGC